MFTLTLVIGRPPETRQKAVTVSQQGRCLASFLTDVQAAAEKLTSIISSGHMKSSCCATVGLMWGVKWSSVVIAFLYLASHTTTMTRGKITAETEVRGHGQCHTNRAEDGHKTDEHMFTLIPAHFLFPFSIPLHFHPFLLLAVSLSSVEPQINVQVTFHSHLTLFCLK